jgi:hypothetical protein
MYRSYSRFVDVKYPVWCKVMLVHYLEQIRKETVHFEFGKGSDSIKTRCFRCAYAQGRLIFQKHIQLNLFLPNDVFY